MGEPPDHAKGEGHRDSAVAYYAASLPLIAGAAADRELFAAYQNTNRDRGTGPQLALEQLTDYLTECQEAGELPRGALPHTLALTLCGTAQFEAYAEYIIGPDALEGDRADRLTAAADMLLAAASFEGVREA